MVTLKESEKSILEKIAGSNNTRLAKRAIIILMSQNNASIDNIAKEVELSAQTVKRWQSKFEQERLGIFPDRVLAETEPDESSESPAAAEPAESAQVAEETPPAAEQPATKLEPAPEPPPVKAKKASAKKKAKKRETSIKFPPRKSIGLTPTDSFAEAGRKVLGFHFARMLKHEPGTRLGEDIEELHDMRVATRRMRAAFRLFGESYAKKAIKPLLKGLRATGQALGPVRDLDVFMEKLEQYRQTLPEEEQAGLQPLFNMWDRKRQSGRQKMLDYLDSKKYKKFTQKFLEFVKTEELGAKPIPDKVPPVPYQLRHIAPGLIYSAYKEVRAYETVLDSAPIETLHRLRISFKRLRYTLEYLQEILGPEGKTVVEDVKAMQDHLGNLNDADVASEILREFLSDWEAHQLHLPLDQRQSPAPIANYLNAKLKERHELLVSFPKAWAHFNRPEMRHNLAKAISVL